MIPQEPFSVDEAQMIREEFLAPAYRRLEAMAETMPQHGQQLAFAKNHIRMAFMELGFGMALTNGLDPLANKVSK
jgi:hypothetical protein